MHNKPGWSRADVSGDTEELIEIASTLNKTRPRNVYFVVGFFSYFVDAELSDQIPAQVGDNAYLLSDGGGPALYRIETEFPLQIIEAFGISSHSPSGGVDALIEQMAAIHKRNPIVPFYADDATLQCTFERPLTKDFCDFLDEVVVEGVESYAQEDDWDGTIGSIVMNEGCLRLWWD
jgi:hypothetical protein